MSPDSAKFSLIIKLMGDKDKAGHPVGGQWSVYNMDCMVRSEVRSPLAGQPVGHWSLSTDTSSTNLSVSYFRLGELL